MSVARAPMSCSECGYRASQWRGRCPQCGAWDSFVNEAKGPRAAGPAVVGLPVAGVLYYVFTRSVDVAAETRVAEAEGAELEEAAQRRQ